MKTNNLTCTIIQCFYYLLSSSTLSKNRTHQPKDDKRLIIIKQATLQNAKKKKKTRVLHYTMTTTDRFLCVNAMTAYMRRHENIYIFPISAFG